MVTNEIFPWVVSAIALPAIGTLFVFVWVLRSKLSELGTTVEQRIAETKSSIYKTMDENRRALDMNLITAKDDFKDFQIKVLEEFVPYRALRDFEERVMNLLGKMDSKIDKIADRAERS